MARSIKLIVTGDMEKAALHESLQKFFPNKQHGTDVIWGTPRKTQGATSYQLKPLTTGGSLSNPMKQLAKAMLAEVLDGKRGEPADLVMVIDDVELGNLGKENIIAEHFRAAVEDAIKLRANGTTSEETRLRDVVRNKCSFHLLKPMVEAYLFGDSNALGLAGVPSGIIPRLVHPTDVEEFETNEPQWLSSCHLENTKQRINNPWWCQERHPKHYLEYLTGFYDETIEGKKALMQLDWYKVPKCQNDIPIFRSLFEDISDWFGIANPITGITHPSFYPEKTVRRVNLLLRNM